MKLNEINKGMYNLPYSTIYHKDGYEKAKKAVVSALTKEFGYKPTEIWWHSLTLNAKYRVDVRVTDDDEKIVNVEVGFLDDRGNYEGSSRSRLNIFSSSIRDIAAEVDRLIKGGKEKKIIHPESNFFKALETKSIRAEYEEISDYSTNKRIKIKQYQGLYEYSGLIVPQGVIKYIAIHMIKQNFLLNKIHLDDNSLMMIDFIPNKKERVKADKTINTKINNFMKKSAKGREWLVKRLFDNRSYVYDKLMGWRYDA